MDDTELHYLTYDPDAILQDMMETYAQAGGSLLYAGDEKEMLLQAMLQIMVQAFAGIDNALRMATLRYAVRDYLELIGENRNCPIIQAQAAKSTVKITLEATGVEGVIPKGTTLTADGAVLYQTVDDLVVTGSAQELTAQVECLQSGSVGNGLIAGTEMTSLIPIDGDPMIVCTVSATGGQDKEEQEAYRERIRTSGLASVTTGPQQRYEAVAKAVSSQVINARALNTGGGNVGVYIISASETGMSALLSAVNAALSAKSERPMTDHVSVLAATPVPYTLNVRYSYDGSSSVQTMISEAIRDYKEWQEQTIGRAFAPDRLSAMLYQAGATRVLWGAGSEFNGDSTIAYTEIAENEYCKGTINQAVIEG